MKAAAYRKFGNPEEVVKIEEIDKPEPKNDEVLVKVQAASIQFADLTFIRGKPRIVRLFGAGIFSPRHKVMGSDISGTVEKIGNNVKQFKQGDDVFGDISVCGYGGFAQYVCVPEKDLVLKPKNMTHEDASAVPQVSGVALQGLRDAGKIKAGQKVLIHGASGGIGSFAVQIAKYYGAEVTGVCSTENIDLVRSMGADHVIDYKKDDFSKSEEKYDLIFDIVANRPVTDFVRALKPKGIYVAGALNLNSLFKGKRLAKKDQKTVKALVSKTNTEDLVFIRGLLETGKIKPIVDSCYRLNQISEALEYYGKGTQRERLLLKYIER